MENASKALIMAATVLLGVMIISVGVALFNTFSEFGRDTLQKVEDKRIAEWNNNFLKYYGYISTEEDKNPIPIKVSAHDIVSVANLAKQNNENYELTKENSGNENTYYVQVIVKGKYQNFETESDTEKNKFLQENSLIESVDANGDKTADPKYYKCSKEPVISKVTKRVISIEFEEY